jgi:hypothetical protein
MLNVQAAAVVVGVVPTAVVAETALALVVAVVDAGPVALDMPAGNDAAKPVEVPAAEVHPPILTHAPPRCTRTTRSAEHQRVSRTTLSSSLGFVVGGRSLGTVE